MIMKKTKRIVSFFLAFVVICTLFAAVPSVNLAVSAAVDITADFTDPNFLAAVREIIGKPTGAIYDTDVAGITSLNVGDKNITDLSGIEHFTALKYLDCGGNQLTELDMSKNTALTGLRCDFNHLTALNVSNKRDKSVESSEAKD